MDVKIALKEALRYQSNRDFTSAKRIYDSILIQLPHQPDANHNLGVLAISVGQPQKGIPLIQKAITHDPLKVNFWESLISVQLHLKQFSQSYISLRRAQEFGHESIRIKTLSDTINQTNFRLHMSLNEQVRFVNELREQGWFEACLAECQAFRMSGAENFALNDCVVRCYLATGNFAEAEGLLTAEQELKKEPRFPYLLNRIRLKLLTKDLSGARALLTSIADGYSENRDLQLLEATFLRLIGDIDQSTRILNQLLERSRSNHEVLVNRALCSIAKGDSNRALSDLTKAFILRPNNKVIWQQLLTLNLATENYQEIIQVIIRMISIDPTNDNLIQSAVNVIHKMKTEPTEYKLKMFALIDRQVNYSEFLKFHYGLALQQAGEQEKAIDAYKQVLQLNPKNHHTLNNLGVIHKDRREHKAATRYLTRAIQAKPEFLAAHNNLGITYTQDRQFLRAIETFQGGLLLNPTHASMLMNLGVAQKRLGLFDQALDSMLKSLNVDGEASETHLNLGTVYTDLADMTKAKKHLLIAANTNPKLIKAYWNLCATAASTDEAEKLIDQILVIDQQFSLALMYKAGLRAIDDDFKPLIEIRQNNHLATHAYTRSFEWYLALGYKPSIFFNRWDLFNHIATLTEVNRPFYEFGVWTAASFRYLINTYKKGYGFDTFSGLPENWHGEAEGSYSAQGVVPRIDGGEFVVGAFEDTLPNFFSEPRPVASLINFDADLYSSTICALENCHPIIDEKTILIFDEFIMNTNWEQDEYKALEEFCQRHSYGYQVIAVSFFEKQVAVQLIKE